MSVIMQEMDRTSADLHTLFGPKLKTRLPGPIAAAVIARDRELLSPSYTRDYPLVVKRGRGCRIEDVDGNEFLDFTAGIAVNSTGHAHPEVVAAVQAQAADFLHMSGTDFYYDLMPRVAERLSALAPMAGPHKFYYGNSGAEAVECALKLARYHTGRQNIISFLGSFHGRTMGALSLTASKPQQKRRFGPFVPGVTHVRYPMRIAAAAAVRGLRRPSDLRVRGISKTSSSRRACRLKRSLRSSLSRSRARVDTSFRQTSSLKRYAASATATES